ncbi:uncharacterized protein PAF06_016088 [Gastrophryne carolinensis]
MSFFPGSHHLFLFAYIFTFVTGLPLNFTALCTLIKKFKQEISPVDILLVNLTISDLLLLTFLPFRMQEAASGMNWKIPYIFCPLSAFMFFSSIYITSLFLMAISVERYLAVAYPIKYKIFRKPIYSVMASVFFWCIAAAHCSIVLIVEHGVPGNITNSNTTLCYSTFSPPQLEVLLPVRLEIFLLLFCVPFVITVFCYVKFIKIIMSQVFLDKRRKIRANCLVAVTLVNFLVCFTPYNLSHVFGFFQGESPEWRIYALLLSTFNAMLDPIIFYFSSASFKKALLEELVYVLKKLNLGNWCYKLCIDPCERETRAINVSCGDFLLNLTVCFWVPLGPPTGSPMSVKVEIATERVALVLDRQHNHLALAIYILTFITGLPSNLLAFYAFLVKVRKKPSPVDILLLNLTISDLLLLMFLPLKMKEILSKMVWDMPLFLCPLTGFCYFSSIYISTLCLTAVSIERYVGVAFPIKYKLHRKPQNAVFAIIIFWLVSCGHCTSIYIVHYCVPNNNVPSNITRCYMDFSKEQLKILLPVRLEMAITLFFIPSIITLFCYINFIRILMCLPNIHKKRKQRAIGLAIATLANYCICFMPYNISHVVGFLLNQSPKWRAEALLLSTFNATLDPVIFYFTSATVRKTFTDFLAAILKKIREIGPCKKLQPQLEDVSLNKSNLDISST